MRCPKCQHPKNFVTDSRKKLRTIQRTRECQKCSARWSTTEILVHARRSVNSSRLMLIRRLQATQREISETIERLQKAPTMPVAPSRLKNG
ncbi:hypothetical protein EP7_004291 [Isosphaeraceae bacterium EP7]